MSLSKSSLTVTLSAGENSHAEQDLDRPKVGTDGETPDITGETGQGTMQGGCVLIICLRTGQRTVMDGRAV